MKVKIELVSEDIAGQEGFKVELASKIDDGYNIIELALNPRNGLWRVILGKDEEDDD